jgi:tetratricopeptide (TPR) repeat protein
MKRNRSTAMIARLAAALFSGGIAASTAAICLADPLAGPRGDAHQQAGTPDPAKPAKGLDDGRKLIEAAIGRGRYVEASRQLDPLLKNAPNDCDLLMLEGRCQLGLGKNREAAETFRRIIQLAPDQVNAYTYRAFVLQRLGRPKEADEVMQQLAEDNPTLLPAQLLYDTYLLRLGRFDDAGKQAKKVLSLAPDNYQGLMLAGHSALAKANLTASGKEQEEQYAEAKEYAERAIRVAAGTADGYQLLAQIHAKTGHRDEALATLQRGIEKTAGTPGYPGLLWEVAQIHLDNGKPLEAQKIAEQLKRLNSDPTPLTCLEARIEMELGHWTAALAGFDSVRPMVAASRQNWQVLRQVDYWTGLCYAQTGNVEQELAAYRRAVATDPTYFPARDGIAKIYVTAGRLSDAVAEYRQAIKAGKPDEKVMVALARTMILRNLHMPEAQRDWDSVKAELAEARFIAPNSPQLPLLQAEVLMATNRLADAEKLLLDLTSKAPNNLDFWLALAEIDERQGKWEAAKEHLQQAADKLGDSVPLRAARARYLLRHKGNDAAREIQKLAEDHLEKFSSDDRVQLCKSLFPYSIQAGDYATARRLCQAAAEKDPNNVRIRYALFELILRAQEHGAAGNEKMMADLERVLGEMEAAGGRGPLWLYGKAAQLKVQANDDKDSPLLEQALDYVAKAREMRPTWAPLPLLAARIYEIQKKEDQMLENDLQAINLGEHDPAIVKRTVQLLKQKQRYAEADALLSRLAEGQTSLTPEQQRE